MYLLNICKFHLQFYPRTDRINQPEESGRIKGKSKDGVEPSGYATHLPIGKEVTRMEIAYIVAMAIVAVVAILAHRNMKK